MKTAFILCAWLFAACTFDPSGIASSDVPDAASDQDAGTDADGAPPAPASTIVCSTETVAGQPKQVLTFDGDVEAGFLPDSVPAEGAVPVAIQYGTDPVHESQPLVWGCGGDTWASPYPTGCQKPQALWSVTDPMKIYLEPEADFLNVALVYSDDTVRWGDLKTADGDAVGFDVSGTDTGFDCRIELVNGGVGGSIRINP